MVWAITLGRIGTSPLPSWNTSTWQISLIIKWKSYFSPLWKKTGILNLVGDSSRARLHLECAGPLYLPVKWQWSITFESRGSMVFWQIWHILESCKSWSKSSTSGGSAERRRSQCSCKSQRESRKLRTAFSPLKIRGGVDLSSGWSYTTK